MPSAATPKRGQVVSSTGSGMAPMDAANVFTQVVSAYSETKQVSAQEATKRSEIEADERIQLAQIHTQQALLLDYLDKSFAERADNFRNLFRKVDAAQERGDSAVVGQLLESVVDLAKTSPFGDLLDLKNIEAILADEKHHHRI